MHQDSQVTFPSHGPEGRFYDTALLVEWLNRHPCRTNPGRCAACGEPDREGHAVVPFGTETHGHTWLHPQCWQGWHETRKAEAITALAVMEIEKPPRFSNDFGKNGST